MVGTGDFVGQGRVRQRDAASAYGL